MTHPVPETKAPEAGGLFQNKKQFIVISRFLIVAILFLLLYYDQRILEGKVLAVIVIYAITNVVFSFAPPHLFESTRISTWFFLFDTGVVSVLLWFVSSGGTELYLVYYLTIFIAAIAKSANAAFFTCMVSASLYALLTLYGKTQITIDSFPFAVRTLFFFVTAMFVGYLSEEVRREREAKESTLSLLRITRRLATLFDISKRMVSVTDLGVLQRQILEVAMEVLEADGGSVMLVEPEKKDLRISSAVGIPEEVRGAFVGKVGEGIAGWVAQYGEPLLLPADLEYETRFRSLAPRRGIVSAVCAPLRLGDQILGVINLNKAEGKQAFRKDDLNLLVTLANFAAIVLDKARLHTSLDVAHADLRDVADELAALFETASDAIVVFSSETGKISKVNYEATRLTGFARKDLLERQFQSLFAPADLDKVNELVAHSVRTGSAKSDEVSVLRWDKSALPVRISASLAGFGKREIVQAVIGDISDRKRMEQHLARTERLRALGELASGVAHDFGNIIGAILGYAQRLRGSAQTEKDKKAVDIIEKSARDGSEIVRRIQDATRSRTASVHVPVRLADVVKDSIAYTRSRWKSLDTQGARIEVRERAEYDGSVSGNAAELREVFTNILLNATDAMPAGGVLRVETAREGETALVRVQDTGVGMSDEVKEKIFDPFFSTKGSEGTGLGLSIAYNIVTAHGGRIDVESAPGKGATFTIALPVSEEAVRPEPVAAGPSPEIPPLTYLVIDDDEKLCQLLRDLLTRPGTQVYAASDVDRGLDIFERVKPDVVLTDFEMPDRSGLEVSRIVKSRNPRTSVIIITAMLQELSEEAASASGVDHILPKPFGEAEVARAIAAARRAKA